MNNSQRAIVLVAGIGLAALFFATVIGGRGGGDQLFYGIIALVIGLVVWAGRSK